jgi:hypothetical protein
MNITLPNLKALKIDPKEQKVAILSKIDLGTILIRVVSFTSLPLYPWRKSQGDKLSLFDQTKGAEGRLVTQTRRRPLLSTSF